MTETADHAPRRVKAAILRTLAGSAHPRLEAPNLAHRFNMTIEDVKAIATAHGGIDQPTRLLKAAKALEENGGPDRPTTPVAVPAPQDSPLKVERSPGTATGPATTSAPTAAAGSVETLLARADKSTKARTRNAAARIRQLVVDLSERVEEEARARREAARAAEEKAQAAAAELAAREKARAEVERLERQLKAAKAKLRGKAKPATSKPGRQPSDSAAAPADGQVPCPAGCGRAFASAQGAALHHTRTHRKAS